MFTVEKQNLERYFCHKFSAFPSFSGHLSCWILEIYCLFSDLIRLILSQRMTWVGKNIFPPCYSMQKNLHLFCLHLTNVGYWKKSYIFQYEELSWQRLLLETTLLTWYRCQPNRGVARSSERGEILILKSTQYQVFKCF